MDKFYVSTFDGAFNGGIKRLTPYYKTRTEAESYYQRVYHAYNSLLLRMLTGKKRHTLKTK